MLYMLSEYGNAMVSKQLGGVFETVLPIAKPDLLDAQLKSLGVV